MALRFTYFLIMAYLTMLSAAHTIQRRVINTELEATTVAKRHYPHFCLKLEETQRQRNRSPSRDLNAVRSEYKQDSDPDSTTGVRCSAAYMSED
jgi:hypothetical protein